MYSPKTQFKNGNVYIKGIEHFDLKQTLDCGQAFRWSPIDEHTWHGAALGRYIKIGLNGDKIILYNTDIDEYELKWKHYFDFDRDYGKIIDIISADKILKKAAAENKGIRILNQDSWEALCSFIISQNNNIPRIKGIIERLCAKYGQKLENDFFSFPSAEIIANLSPDDLSDIRCGFRARYIIDGAKKYLNGDIDLDYIRTASTDDARNELMKITGVGVKVADCTLLFGFGRIDALPKDVWIKRAIEEYFGGNFPECALPYAGIAQQYLFNYIRTHHAK